MTIKQLLNTLSKEQYQVLRCAFEDETSHYIILDDGETYLGVNCHELPVLIPESIEGCWSTGKVKE